MDSAWRITGPWCWACRIGANRKESCCGLSSAAASDTKGPSRGGKNWRHSPPRSTVQYFAFCSPCQVLFAFYSSLVTRCTALVQSAHTDPSSGLFAAAPQGILSIREDRRAKVPTSTVTSLCARRPFGGHGAPLPCATSSVGSTACISTSACAAIQPGSSPVKPAGKPGEEAPHRTTSTPIYPLPDPPSCSGRRPVLEPPHRLTGPRAA